MSRPRTIDQDGILDAAERVVLQRGAARLTLDAVAREAGISKASVIYDYKTKHDLIKAVIERKVAEDLASIDAAALAAGSVPNARLFGHLATAVDIPPDDKRAVAVNLCAALAQDAELRVLMQRALKREVAAVLESSDTPRSAVVAFLAVQGLKLLELLGLRAWSEAERRKILQDIGELAAADMRTRAWTDAPLPRPGLREDAA